METQILDLTGPEPDSAQVAVAVEALRRGQLVALPTETVYGLAGAALDLGAVAGIFAAKERPTFDPLIVHLPSEAWLERVTAGLSPAQSAAVARLGTELWPGPLTLLLPKNAELVADLVTAGSPLVAVRRSAHPVFRAVIEALDQPLAAPSANRFGCISPTRAAHVLSELGGRIPYIVDGGECSLGVESTILKIDAAGCGSILRPGPYPVEQLENYLEILPTAPNPAGGSAEAPGTLESHYAPRKPMHLVDDAAQLPAQSRKRMGYLTWGDDDAEGGAEIRYLCRLPGDWSTAARNLFSMMRELDGAPGVEVIYARRVPEQGLGRAIMDRLRRAATR